MSTRSRKPSILVVYFAPRAPMRGTISDHLFSFKRYSDADCAYINMSVREIPDWVARSRFDLIVFHTTLLSVRWNRTRFMACLNRVAPLSSSAAVRIALPQDEFIHTDLLCEFVREMKVDHVFSVAPPEEWARIYPGMDRSRTRLHHVLTGYLDERTVARIDRLQRRSTARPVDIGYRAYGVRHSLGTHGYMKIRLADAVIQRAKSRSLRTDISTRYEDTLYGDAWYRFLLRCRYALGVEGGASLLDRDGRVWQRTQDYVRRHPEASFHEVEEACFPGLDGSLGLTAISPRHLEACATRTGQILVEGAYNGILESGRHYLPVARDLGNLDEILGELGEEPRRLCLVERAYSDIVESGLYTYRAFVQHVLRSALEEAGPTASSRSAHPMSKSSWGRLRAADRLSWARPGIRGLFSAIFYGLVRLFPESFGRWAKARRHS